MKSQKIRQLFLDYFSHKNHKIIASSSLVPVNDPTLLFVNSGMVQFKEVFLGQESVNYNRATTIQRCVRAGGKHNDLENVGYTARHHTFFEMMGNFSFGNYFKREAINFAWQFLVEELNLPIEKLWITVYQDDQETEDIWLNELKVSPQRFSRCGKADNFWSMGDTGPCGPCSEIFYDHGSNIAGGPPGSADEDGDRYIEIWNLVFMQFNRDSDGTMTKLPKPSVDTGLGLERLAAILQNVHSNYEIDLFQSLMLAIASIIRVKDHNQTSIKVIADHIRSCAFMVVDGIVPSNEGRGYVLRRIIRRAIRHAHKLGCKDEFFYKIVSPLVVEMGEAYPELAAKQVQVEKVLKKEEQRFAETIEIGIKILHDYISKMGDNHTISGEMVFKLYDTYGFPYDLTQDIARENQLKLDRAGYDLAMQNQQNMARSAGAFKATNVDLKISGKSEFVGYQHLKSAAIISDIFINEKSVNMVSETQAAIMVLDKTPFYAESGGQIGDIGTITVGSSIFTVTDTQKYQNTIIHIGKLNNGSLKIGNKVTAKVIKNTRQKIASNHSATHLLHAALRQILGEHIQQKGSLVTDQHLRFDFSHDGPVSTAELQKIEDLVNQQTAKKTQVTTEIMDIEAAKKLGAVALFGGKYSEEVRVLTMGDFSMELCGGTHVTNTGEIGIIKIIGESGIASGVRRIEAISGLTVIELLQNSHQTLQNLCKNLNANSDNISDKIQNLAEQNKQLSKQLTELKQKLAYSQNADLATQAIEINGIKLLIATLENMDAKTTRSTIDDLKSTLNPSVILLASISDGKISLVCGVSKILTEQIKAGDIMQEITSKIGGKGGGRADMAQGGGSDIASLVTAMADIKLWIKDKLS